MNKESRVFCDILYQSRKDSSYLTHTKDLHFEYLFRQVRVGTLENRLYL